MTNYVAEASIYQTFKQRFGRELRGTPTFLLFSPEGVPKAVNPGRISVENVVNFTNDTGASSLICMWSLAVTCN